MWELNLNRTLTNSYSGLCATVNYAEGGKDVNLGVNTHFWGIILCFKHLTADCSNAATANSGGVRSWIATGRQGLDSEPLTRTHSSSYKSTSSSHQR